MTTQIWAALREAAVVEDAHVRPMMGPDVLEPLPSERIPCRTVDPFILVHEAVVPITPERGRLGSRPQQEGATRWPPIAWSTATMNK
jgi:hypothetical protein